MISREVPTNRKENNIICGNMTPVDGLVGPWRGSLGLSYLISLLF